MNGFDVVAGIAYGAMVAQGGYPPGACDPRGVCYPWYDNRSITLPLPPQTYIERRPDTYARMPIAPPPASLAPPPAPRVEAPVVVHVLKCKFPLDRTDKNPVIQTWVSIQINDRNNLVGMSVEHDRYYGDKVFRLQQYNSTFATDNAGTYGWKGTLNWNHDVVMAGGVFLGQDGLWHYREKMWENGKATWDWTSQCELDPPGE